MVCDFHEHAFTVICILKEASCIGFRLFQPSSFITDKCDSPFVCVFLPCRLSVFIKVHGIHARMTCKLIAVFRPFQKPHRRVFRHIACVCFRKVVKLSVMHAHRRFLVRLLLHFHFIIVQETAAHCAGAGIL